MFRTNFINYAEQYQRMIISWTKRCFLNAFNEAAHPVERRRRFGEESIELLQACGMPIDELQAIVKYVYGRPPGEPGQEVGGVMVTLAQLCEIRGINYGAEAIKELERIDTPELIEKIRGKQVSKQLHGIGGTPL
jgi:hypothetical protein